MKGYIIFKRQEPKRSCYVWLNGEKAQIAKGVTAQLADDTARPIVDKSEIRKAYKFGGEQIIFTPNEIASLRHFGEPGIRIIGFKPVSMLPIWANVRPATFLYPSEEDYVGSSRVFAALHTKLLRDNKIGLAWFVARKNAVPVIAALLPGAEDFSDEGAQLVPAGLWLIPLPFADDIRSNPETQLIRAPESLIDAMRIIIQQLQLPGAVYRPEKYPNPSLQWHYRILQAMALDEDLPEKAEDKTVPRYRQIEKRAGPYIKEWGDELEKVHTAWAEENRSISTSISAKRPASSAITEEGESKKRAKTASGVSGGRVQGVIENEVSDANMREHFKKNSLGKLTVALLKNWLLSKGLDGSGRKSDLMERAESYFETK